MFAWLFTYVYVYCDERLFEAPEVLSLVVLIYFEFQRTTFFNDWERGVSGILKGDCQHPRNSFAIKLVAFVEGESCTGYLAEVMREVDKKMR